MGMSVSLSAALKTTAADGSCAAFLALGATGGFGVLLHLALIARDAARG